MNAGRTASPGEVQIENDRPDPQPGAERWIVDALEHTPGGLVARLERPDGTTCDLPLSALPRGLRGGEVLSVEGGPDGVTVRRLPAQTQARRNAAQTRLDALNALGETGGAAGDDSGEMRP